MKNRIAFFDIISIALIAALTFIFVNTVCSTPMVYASIEAPTPIGMVEMVNSEAQTEFIPDANVEIVDTEIQIVFLKQQ
jgi:hypothetical protein